MIVQEPVQAAIWHCLNHYDYSDAVFLSERLYAEVKTDDSLFLLATSYYRNGQKDHAYHILKDRPDASTQCRYLLGTCAYDLEKYVEAEAALLRDCSSQATSLDDVTTEYGDQASFALSLLAKIAAKTERKQRAAEAWRKALKLNPFQWSSFESLCKLGEKPNPHTTFQISQVEDLSMCHGSNINNIESVIITNSSPNQENQDVCLSTPQQILTSLNANSGISNSNNSKLITPDESPVSYPQSLWLSGIRPMRKQIEAEINLTPQPSFGHLYDATAETYVGTPNHSHPKLIESNMHHQSLAKRVKAQMDQLISRKESVQQSCKPLFSQSVNVAKTPNASLPVQQLPCPNVRRSSRLFSNNSCSVKENNKSPTRTKFAAPKSPSRKTSKQHQQRIAKCNSKNAGGGAVYENNRNRSEKERSETVTSSDLTTPIVGRNDVKASAIISGNNQTNSIRMENYVQQAMHMQKQSADGLMSLLRSLGQAVLDLSCFNCTAVIDALNSLPPHQFDTPWVHSMLGLAHFELADYDASIRHFETVHTCEPHRIQFMDVYSTALWHLQKEVALSALAQDLIALDKSSPITWCVNGNCFSLHKEHDTAIKFFQRAVQVDSNFPYGYTLLGHEYITTEELDKAMSCFRNAIRLDPRHYNAWFGIGTIYSKQERYHLAEINYARALQINPQSSVILCHIGIVQRALKNFAKALNTFNVAIAKNPNSPLCKFHRGYMFFALDRYTEALQELEELRKIVPKESQVYYLIGKVHKKLGNTDLALMHFSWATDLDPKGASSQIKEAIDPSMGRSSAAVESPASPTESNPAWPRPRNFGNEDSEDSF